MRDYTEEERRAFRENSGIPDHLIYDKVTNEWDDWRIMGQETDLMDRAALYCEWFTPDPEWDHDHCDFCGARFGTAEGDLRWGYYFASVPGEDKCDHWVCEGCYNDFQHLFHWESLEYMPD